MGIKEYAKRCGCSFAQSTKEEIYDLLLGYVKEKAKEKVSNQGKKKLYYISAEFLIGKMLSNNLINLGVYEEVKEVLKEHGMDLAQVEEIETEASLGNGGLGRLAACFLDSIATLGLHGDGIGLNYHFGLFQQVFKNHQQTEIPNPWIKEKSWLTKTEISYPISLGKFSVSSRMYDMDIIGYHGRTTKLHLFDLESVDETLVTEGITFDKTKIDQNLTLFLYPDDGDKDGRLLRVYQQYFMVANGARLILEECVKRGSNLYDLADYAVVQINDTHPTMIILEFIFLLRERGFTMDQAVDVVSRTCAYTNHTILAEALEKWPLSFMKTVVPHLVPIIYELDQRVKKKYKNPEVAIINEDGYVCMSHIDIHFGFSINGVAQLHTEILKNSELKSFYQLYPEKFNNKTNGITFRRWLLQCNPDLTNFIEGLIGPGFKKDAMELERLEEYLDQDPVLEGLLAIKRKSKIKLKDYLMKTQNISVDENSIFDIQIKRLHEYKRQQMNVLYAIHKYLEIKAGKIPKRPISIIFGGKAAPAYVIAKDIIHTILCLQQVILNDLEVSPYLKVIMVENYNVTLGEKLICACDISEQISLASKEASGTGNMKFMLNGAVTLGTMDGANIEIAQLVGKENIFIFGKDSETVINHYRNRDYISNVIYGEDQELRRAVDFIIGDEMKRVGKKENLQRLYKNLVEKDWFMTFLDWRDYVTKKEEVLEAYEDRKDWAKKMLFNISRAGYFSSDRTILQYNEDIWKLDVHKNL